MKNTLKFFGIIAIAAIIGFSMAACEPVENDDNTLPDPSPLEGTWESTTSKSAYIFERDKFTVKNDGAYMWEGTFTYTDTSFTMTVTEADSSLSAMVGQKTTYQYLMLNGRTLILTDTTSQFVFTKDGGGHGNHTGECLAKGSTGPGGGRIYYHDCKGFAVTGANAYIAYNLEVAYTSGLFLDTVNNLGKLKWATAANSPYATVSRLAEGKAIGRGRNNTALILQADPTAPAAKACVDYRGGDKTDWFLPSIDELYEIYMYLAGSGSGSDELFWSSTQFNADHAYYENLVIVSDDYMDNAKNQEYKVRAIRAF